MKSRILACFCVCALYLTPLLAFGQVPPATVITGFFPTAQCSGGTVIIVGRNFLNVEMVRFGRTNAAVFMVNRTGDTIRAIVDRNGASGAIGVITPIAAVSTSANFTFLRPNDITQTLITEVRPFPLSVRETAVEATLVGTFAVSCTNPTGSVNLTKSVGDSTLRMSVVPIIRSETERIFTVPQAFMRTTGNIVCTFTDGVSAPVTTTLTVTARQPRITSISPSSTNATAQAFQLVINGEDFRGDMQVAFGGVPITVVSTSANRIVANVPGSQNSVGIKEVAIAISNGNVVKHSYTIGKRLPSPAISVPRFHGRFLHISGDFFQTGATVMLLNNSLSFSLPVVSITEQLIIVELISTIPDALRYRHLLVITNPDGQYASQQQSIIIASTFKLLSLAKFFPNPAHETINIETDNPTPRTVTLVLRNILGQELMRLTKEMPAGRVTTPLDVERFPAGTYFLEIQSDSGERNASERVVERLVKY